MLQGHYDVAVSFQTSLDTRSEVPKRTASSECLRRDCRQASGRTSPRISHALLYACVSFKYGPDDHGPKKTQLTAGS